MSVKTLEDKNRDLESQLLAVDRELDRLRLDNRLLKAELSEQKRLSEILDLEKSSRKQASHDLKMLIRQYMQRELDQLKDFLLQTDILDYVGSEQIARTEFDAAPAALVDLANPVPRRGTLTGFSAVLAAPTKVSVAVLRPLNGRYVVVWKSQEFEVNETGAIRLSFPVSIGVEQGDVLAYEFSESVEVSFDRGTGDTRLFSKRFSLGDFISLADLKQKKEKRAYSLGVFAILE